MRMPDIIAQYGVRERVMRVLALTAVYGIAVYNNTVVGERFLKYVSMPDIFGIAVFYENTLGSMVVKSIAVPVAAIVLGFLKIGRASCRARV